MEKSNFTSPEIAEKYIAIGVKKTSTPFKKEFLLAIMAGIFLSLVSQATNQATHTILSTGVAKTLAGVIFPAGLILIIIAGAELFTGNCLVVISCLEKKVKWSAMLKNLVTVYLGNLVGSLIISVLMFYSGQFGFSGGMLGAYTIKTAVYKVGLDFMPAFIMGILCNILVCVAVWMATATSDVGGKILAMFFPIWVFVISGFEHSIANMYYIPAGILAKANPQWAKMAVEMGVTPQGLESLNWGSFIYKNLLPVTIGNIVGGAIFVGFMYWVIYLKNKAE